MTIPRERRTIYFVWNYLNWGGAQIYLLAVMKLARSDWDIVVYLPQGSAKELLRFLEDTGAEVRFLRYSLDNSPAAGFMDKLQRQWRRIKSELEIFRELVRSDLRKSIVHIELAPWQSWQLLAALSLRGANVFVTLHNFLEGGSSLRRAIWKTRLRFVSRLRRFHVFASNRDTKKRFEGWFSPGFHKRIEITYTSVNPAEIAKVDPDVRSAAREKLGIDQSECVVLCVGQFIDRKGRWEFVEAAKLVREEAQDVRFVWLMPKLPDRADLDLIAAYELGDAFLPVLSSSVGSERMDVLSFFRIADIFALPSRVEGLPIALLEAMASGIPSISTNVFAIPEAIVHNETGVLIDAGNAEALGEAILRLRSNMAERERLGENGRLHVLARFDERVAAATVIKAYERCFNE